MICIKFIRFDDRIVGFESDGHAGFADKGEDIVCSAVSVLTINTINSIEKLTKDKFNYNIDDDGHLEFVIDGTPSDEAELLLNSLFIGLCGIIDEYGNKFIRIEDK